MGQCRGWDGQMRLDLTDIEAILTRLDEQLEQAQPGGVPERGQAFSGFDFGQG